MIRVQFLVPVLQLVLFYELSNADDININKFVAPYLVVRSLLLLFLLASL